MLDIDDDHRPENAVLAGGPGSAAVGLGGAAAHAVHRGGKIMSSTHVDVIAETAGPGADLEPTI